MIKWLIEFWEETKHVWNDPNFIERKGGVNEVSPLGGKRPLPPKGQGLPSQSKLEITIN